MKKLILLFSLFLIPLLTLAVGGASFQPTIENPLKAQNLTELIDTIFEIIITLGTPVLVIMIILVGFRFVMAKGNKAELDTAKRSLAYTLIGAAIILGAWAIEKTLENTVEQLKSGVVHSGATISYNLER